ncbi:MAG: cytochrome c oxidase subunit II [Bacteroidetes bacterium]|nr:MAG: cytochrome c oxidase subunit II [Bacteroidota bacterium]
MDAQVLISFAQVLLVVIFGLVCLNLYLVFRLKEIDPFARWNPSSINGAMFMGFWIVGVIAIIWTTRVWWDEMVMVHSAVSEQGQRIDGMFWRTMAVSILVVLITNTLLFYYAWKYRSKPGRKAYYYPHNNKLELLWTVVPAIVLTLLIFDGVSAWHDIMGKHPEDSVEIEINGKQFEWTFRYPGADNEFGETHVKYINDGTTNSLGFNLKDRKGQDDLVTTELHLPVGRPVKFTIKSRDVLHSATLAHFRMKMDAVPGMATHFWITPTKTTAEMRAETGKEDFNYELSCQQICGSAHYNMRRIVVVETWEEYQNWLSQQTPFYTQYQQINGGNTADAAAAEPVNVALSPQP